MNLFKSILAIALVAFCVTAQAQISSTPVNLGLNSTYGTIAAQSASNTVAVIDCRKQTFTTLQITFQGSATASDNLTFAFRPSVDGATYDTGAVYPIQLALTTGGVAKTVVTNLPSLPGANFWKLAYITNAAATATVTNYSIIYGIKTGL